MPFYTPVLFIQNYTFYLYFINKKYIYLKL